MESTSQATKRTTKFQLRKPSAADGGSMWTLVKASKVLDVNSAYCYLMLGHFFQDTCLVAEADDQIVGFVTGIRPPALPDHLFIWQVAVDQSQRGKGLGTALIKELLSEQKEVRYLSATIAPSNIASQSLFRRLAKDYEAPVEILEEHGFKSVQFPESGHEDEPMYIVGPLNV